MLAGDRAKEIVKAAIVAVEAQTSAEIVVAVRPRSGGYRHADYLIGFGLSLVALSILLFHPVEFSVDLMPVDVVVAFVVGVVASAYVGPLRRLVVTRAQMRANVALAARGAFVDLGVSKTRDRVGILVFVSAFERAVEVIADVGIDPARLGSAWRESLAKLDQPWRSKDAADGFAAALRELGPILGKVYVRREDDVNELPDEVA